MPTKYATALATVFAVASVVYVILEHGLDHRAAQVMPPAQTRSQDKTSSNRSIPADDHKLSELPPSLSHQKDNSSVELSALVTAATQRASEPEDVASRASRQEFGEISIRHLLSDIQAIARRTDTFYVDHSLSDYVERLKASPQLIRSLLDVYPDIESNQERELLSRLLALTQAVEVEQYAIEQLSYASTREERLNWAKLLRDTGVSSESVRELLMSMMPSMSDPTQLSIAIQAIAPRDMAPDQRTNITQNISSYIQHPDDGVRSAAILAAAQWGDEQNVAFIEQAIMDPSSNIRDAAIAADVRSEFIKNQLLSIMQDNSAPLLLRSRSYLALTNYGLRGFEQEAFEAFQQRHFREEIAVDRSQLDVGASHDPGEDD